MQPNKINNRDIEITGELKTGIIIQQGRNRICVREEHDLLGFISHLTTKLSVPGIRFTMVAVPEGVECV